MQLFEIDADTLQRHIDELGRIGHDDEHGLFRPVYSPQWLEARRLMQSWMDAAGLATRVDAAGNLFGRLAGESDGPVVLSGSHLDTVRNGGRFDGALGIHAALAAVSAIAASGRRPRRTIEVVALCEEEGSRFTDPMWGTQAMLGMIADGTPDALVDEDGVTIAEAMASVGLDARELPSARRDDIACFVELHIEQGGVLEAEGIPMGIVTAITGQRQLSVEVTGKQNHAGTTPMDMRADALVGAALLIAEVESAARELGRPAVATVGMIQASPGSRNVVPGAVSFTVDLRSTDEEQMAEMTRAIEAAAVAIGETRRLDCKVTEVSYHHPVAMSESVRAVIAQVATAAEVTASPMPSGAGHDSQLFAERVPTAMIFTPSVDGISHSPLEFTPIEQIQPCVEVLAGVLWALAERED